MGMTTTPLGSKRFSGTMTAFFENFRLRFSWFHFFRQAYSYAILTLLALLAYFLVSRYVIQTVQVIGVSMSPTLSNAGHYYLNRWAYLLNQPQRTDIVVLKDPRDSTYEVKRVIAQSGDAIYLKSGKVYVNGHLLKEPYLMPDTPTYAFGKSADELICCGRNQYFVMGDNRKNSMDSRTFGPIPRQNILGRLIQ